MRMLEGRVNFSILRLNLNVLKYLIEGALKNIRIIENCFKKFCFR